MTTANNDGMKEKHHNYITEAELKGGPVEPELIRRENMFIRVIRSIFSFHYFNSGNHSKNSQHGKGKASDGHLVCFDESRKPTAKDIEEMQNNLLRLINEPSKTLFDQMILAYLCGFWGVGGYKNWKPVPGIHKDIRSYKKRIAWVVDTKENIEKLLEGKSAKDQIYIYIK